MPEFWENGSVKSKALIKKTKNKKTIAYGTKKKAEKTKGQASWFSCSFLHTHHQSLPSKFPLVSQGGERPLLSLKHRLARVSAGAAQSVWPHFGETSKTKFFIFLSTLEVQVGVTQRKRSHNKWRVWAMFSTSRVLIASL